MRELWRKTFELFRRHPVLWVPYACAEVLAFSLFTLHRMAYKPILYWFARTTKSSVLGGTVTIYDWTKAQHRAILAAIPLEWGTRYVNACLLTAALVATAVCIGMLGRVQIPGWRNVLQPLRVNAKRILIYALKFCAVMLVMTGVLILPVRYANIQLHVGRTTYFPLGITAGLLLNCVVAWIMAPLAIALLRPVDGSPVAAQEKKLSRYFAILVVLGSAILEFAIPRLETHLQVRGRPAATALFALNDLLINLPLLFLFIALGLLAIEFSLPVEPSPAFHLPESVKNLMPLHYPPADEQK